MAGQAVSRERLVEEWRRWAPLAVLLGLCVVIGLFNGNFFSTGNLVRLLNSAAMPIVLCLSSRRGSGRRR